MRTLTQMLDKGAQTIKDTLFVDIVDVYSPTTRTQGYHTVQELTPVQQGIPGLVQTVSFAQGGVGGGQEPAVHTFRIKVGMATPLQVGHVVQVVQCDREPDLVGVRLLVDHVSHNGLALLRAATASVWDTLDSQGKRGLSHDD